MQFLWLLKLTLNQKDREYRRQAHRNNAPTTENENKIESYFLRNVAIPFLDGINMELDERFSNVVQQCSSLLRLIPPVITNKNGNFAITKIL